MDEKIIRLSEENNNASLTQALSSLKNQKVIDLLDARAVEGRGNPVPYLQAIFKERRTVVFKRAIEILNDGDLSSKIATDIVGFLMMELEAFPGKTLSELADMFVNAIKSGSLRNSKWDPQCAIHLAAIFRDIPMTPDELRFVIEKIIRAMKDLEIQELPPLVYQLLLLSTKIQSTPTQGPLFLISEVETISKEQLRHMEGTVILHVTFAVKQDQELGKEFVKYLKTCQTTPGSILTPFNIALGLSIAQIHRFEETIFEFLKSAVLRSFKDEERRKQSKWVRACCSVQEQVLETVHNSLFGWDHVTQGLVQLGFTLMDAFGPKSFVKEAHELVRSEILQQILNRVITKATTPVNHFIDLLASTVHAAPHVLLESLPRVKEALDYLSFLQPKSAEGFLKAIQPLLKISLTLRDSLILVLRKAMFSRQVDARRIAVTGFLLILKHFKIQVDVHVRGNAVSNEALCLEILGNLRRCLTQQADVRMQLYEGLFHVLSRNPQLQQPILDMLNTQGHLLCYLLHSLAKCVENHTQDEEGEHDSMEHILNELEDLFQSLVRRMNKSEMEDFELVLLEYSFADGELSDTAPSHQQGLTLLRASQPLIKYAINTTLQKLKEINDAGVCSGPGGSSKENICKLCCTIARIFWKHVSGESCLLEETEKKEKGKKINSLCVEGFCIVVNIMCCWFPQRLSHFICALDGTQESEKDSTDETVVQEILFAQIKKFQFIQLQSWAHRICTDHNVDDPVLTKCLMSLLYSLTFQSKTSASLVRDVAQDVHSQLGDVDPDLEVEDRTHFAIINPRTAAPTVAVRMCHTVFVLLKYSLLLISQIEKIVEEMDWALVKIKEPASFFFFSLEGKVPDSPESCPRGVLEQAVCHRLCTVVAALHELSQSALPEGPCTEATLKVLTKAYAIFGALAKYYLSLYTQRIGHLPAKFEKLVKMTGTHLSQQVYGLLTYIQGAQAQNLLEQSSMAKNKGKDKKKTIKGQNLPGKAKVMKEVRTIPNLIYAIEQYERYLIQLSKKSKINLMEHFKRSTSRDFKINGATLEAVLRESSDDEEEDEEEVDEEAEDVHNKEQDERGTNDDDEQDDENKEPPRKKGKLMEQQKKASTLGLKRKVARPLSLENK
ncbi:Fanconi anemia group I protein [Acropora cervicornis]|uniref:Fanconi anemia group I protein n=1 Tax=Acropora cervicornis TaxID=6130 RepID=A0AAD9PUW5_ACRCE|nr:Fanconi anemia group I protein [Acropora cervicornis]